MVKAKEIIDILEEFAPPSIQEGWDNSGLIIGNPEREVSGVLLALDCTPEIIDEALRLGMEMIVTHHPLIFKGIKRIGALSNLDRTIIGAVKSDMVVYSAHTNMDKVLEGVSGIMAQKLGLRSVEILSRGSDPAFGLGVVGDFSEPMEVGALYELIKEGFSLEVLKSSKPVEGLIHRVALCGGSGSSLIGAAMESGAQVYICGDIPYHNFFCERDFMVIDIGHYESEVGILDLFSSILVNRIANLAICIKNKNNPIYYR